MKAIQFILVPLLTILTFLYFKKLRTKLMDRLIILAFGGCSVILVLFPDFAQTLAKTLGVGRGVDLVVYLSVIGLAFVNFILFIKVRGLEARLTELVRMEAERQAQLPNGE